MRRAAGVAAALVAAAILAQGPWAPSWARAQEAPPLAPATPAGAAGEGAPAGEQAPAARVRLMDPSRRAEIPPLRRLFSLFGLFGLVGLGWLLSTDRRRFPWRIVIWGMGLQLAFALFVLRTRSGRWLFSWLNEAVVRLLAFTDEGSRFLFGAYLDAEFSFALRVLPTIIFFSSLMGVLYHLGLMQRVVRLLALVMRRTMGTTGPETLSAAANIFVG
ncbi:MAG: hypothetical protein OEY14_12685, partial [Myxococcales bacterium]|nr:hypothetical protein [Myxococcales bacterium]